MTDPNDPGQTAVHAETAERLETTPGQLAPSEHRAEKPRSLATDAWYDLRRRPLFIISLIVILVLVVMAAFPGLFTSKNPHFCDLNFSRQGPSASAWFGYDLQGCDVYARTIYGARASILVGTLTTMALVVLGGLIGMLAGFYGRWVDATLSRMMEIFISIPLVLGAIVILVSFPSGAGTPEWVTIGKVVLALTLLIWPVLARIMRSTVIQVKHADYVMAARGLGGGARRILSRHILPNAMTPVIVYATIALGQLIAAEATLSFLGIGLQPPTISWGIAISDGLQTIRQSPHILLFPAAFLSVTVLAFIMLGDAVRDAFDPKLR
jgi:oligopeptide transport system permease protein